MLGRLPASVRAGECTPSYWVTLFPSVNGRISLPSDGDPLTYLMSHNKRLLLAREDVC